MSDELQKQKRPTHAVLADIGASTTFILVAGAWHRPSRFRGLRPGEGIPDDQRLARTLCGMFVPLPFEQQAKLPRGTSSCISCESEFERGKQFNRGW